MSSDKYFAQADAAINGHLYEPDPSDETGLNSSFRRPSEPDTKQNRLSSGSPKQSPEATTKDVTSGGRYPSPSASPRGSPNHRQKAFASHNSSRPRRSSSLKERFPGDTSPYPLEQLAEEKAVADRARHITKKHAIKPDTIDALDQTGLGGYHHGGPYDATLFARNNSYESSPVAAVAESNTEALKATPHEKIIDSVKGHRPLDGVAAFAPGETDRNGHTYHYKEGENMMTDLNPEGGAYKRWEGIQYHPDDIKGKGEPSYSIEKALKEHSLEDKKHGRNPSGEGIELQSNHSRNNSDSRQYLNEEDGLGRRSSLTNRLRKRVGSLKKKLTTDE